MRKFRIAIVGVRLEATLRSPIFTDTSTMRMYRGEAIRDPAPEVMDGLLDRLADQPDVEVVPLFFVRTLPGGAMDRAVYEKLKAEQLDLVAAAGPLDGLVVANHGAMEVEGLDRHGDTDFITAMHAAVGPDVAITVPFDLHGQVTPELLDAMTVFSVMRTAPHIDVRETSQRAAEQLLMVLREGIKPVKAAVSIPIIAPGELAMTTFSPARELYASLADFDARPDVIEANFFCGMGWNDRPWIGMKAVVTCRSDGAAARAYAVELAEAIWAERANFTLKLESASIEDGLRLSQAASGTNIFLSDSGDNTTAGAGGELTFVLQRALRMPEVEDIIIVGINAPGLVAQCHAAGAGSEVMLRLGEEHRSAPKEIMEVKATVEALGDRMDTSVAGSAAPWARVRMGNVIASFHAARTAFGSRSQFDAIGIASGHKAYVVKLGYLGPGASKMASRHICLTSPGLANLDLTELHYDRIVRPIYPLDPAMEWSAADAVYLA